MNFLVKKASSPSNLSRPRPQLPLFPPPLLPLPAPSTPDSAPSTPDSAPSIPVPPPPCPPPQLECVFLRDIFGFEGIVSFFIILFQNILIYRSTFLIIQLHTNLLYSLRKRERERFHTILIITYYFAYIYL